MKTLYVGKSAESADVAHVGLVVGDAVESVFAKALAVKPADRFQTARDFWGGAC
jgi:hypothetical protein